MDDYKAVRNTHQISVRLLDLLEDAVPLVYNGRNRTANIRVINDILQGRSAKTVEGIFQTVTRLCGNQRTEELAALYQEVRDFQAQKKLLSTPYSKPRTLDRPYQKYTTDPLKPVKIIDQALFDQAAKTGFPLDFFRESFFDGVNIYCMPDSEDCAHTTFQGCAFTACRLHGTMLHNTRLDSCEFHSCSLQNVIFWRAGLSYTHFRDSSMLSVTFQDATLKSCLTVDCTMDGIDFFQARLDGGDYGRIQAANIMNLSDAVITQGGATEEEVQRLKNSIFQELRPQATGRQQPRKRPGPSR